MPFSFVILPQSSLLVVSVFTTPHPTLNNSKQYTKCKTQLLKIYMFPSLRNRSVKIRSKEKINGIYITSMSRAFGKCPKYLCYPPVGQRNYKNRSAPFFKTPCTSLPKQFNWK